ncbi:hypothetical protein WA026_022826 [Henosepilachna vigintioctopunctata]|uniref:SCP domain-containing protein n=1 Tax=Henosepilachna vigintioctopunctata TaxID=420089 RepID=A0AAW1V3V2_9CUCU
MYIKIYLLPLILIYLKKEAFSASPARRINYCKIDCTKGTVHVVCERNYKCGPVDPCKVVNSDVNFRKYILHAHNQARNDIASGKIAGGYNNTGAKDMNAISYDMELEYMAACWNNACKGNRDSCRDTKRFKVSQNVWTAANVTTEAVPEWLGRAELLTDANWLAKFDTKNFPTDEEGGGQFTQLVWAATKYLGCSLVAINNGSRLTRILCNYAPAGNMLAGTVYQIAEDPTEIASLCEKGRKNSEYTSLCGSIEPVPTDPMWSGASQLLSISLSVYFYSFSVFCYFTL